MVKKYALLILFIVLADVHNLAAMQQNQSWWSKFTSWMRSPRKDYVELNTKQVPPHPQYPKEKEIGQLRRVAHAGTGLSSEDFNKPHIASTWRDFQGPYSQYTQPKMDELLAKVNGEGEPLWADESEFPNHGGVWGGPSPYPYKKRKNHWTERVKDGAEEGYSDQVPGEKELQELKNESIERFRWLSDVEVLQAKENLAKAQTGWFWWLNPFATKEKQEVRRAELQQAATKVQLRNLKPHAVELEKWLDEKEKIEQQEVQRRATVKRYEESMEKTPTTLYGE